MEVSKLQELATNISANASIITDFLRKNNHAEFSFDPTSPAKFPPCTDSKVLSARNDLIFAAKQMQSLASGPEESLQFITSGAIDAATLKWIHYFDIPAAVPIDTGMSFAELAKKLNASSKIKFTEKTLTRVLRHAMTNNIFVESTPGHIFHTSLSLQLAIPDNPIRGMVGHRTMLAWASTMYLVEAHEKYGMEGDSCAHTAFNIAMGTDMPCLEWTANDPVASARFTESMKYAANSGHFSTDHIVRSFDWAGLGHAVVVDVGGSAGQASKVIAGAAPQLQFIVQDLPPMAAKGEAELEPSLKERMTFQAHNFFDPNPVNEPAAFLLRWILHDWPDSDAIRIIRQLAASMGPKTVLLINDVVVPPKSSIHPLREKHITQMDMVMMACHNSLERSRDDWVDLVARADPGLKVMGIETPQGSAMSMISVVKQAN